jgi:hypothetical protein
VIIGKEVNSALCIASIPVHTWRESVTKVDATSCCYWDEHNIIRLMVENVFMKNMFWDTNVDSIFYKWNQVGSNLTSRCAFLLDNTMLFQIVIESFWLF